MCRCSAVQGAWSWSKRIARHTVLLSAFSHAQSRLPTALAHQPATNHWRSLFLVAALSSSKKASGRWARDDAKIAAEALRQADARTRAKVVLQDEQGATVKTCTLVDAETCAKQRNMKLTLVDEKKLPKVYRMISREELLALQEAQKASKADKKENKVRKLSSSIADHDLNIKMKDVIQSVADGHSVSLHISYGGEELKDESRKEQVKLNMTARISDSLSTQPATVRLTQSGATFFVLTVSKIMKSPIPK